MKDWQQIGAPKPDIGSVYRRQQELVMHSIRWGIESYVVIPSHLDLSMSDYVLDGVQILDICVGFKQSAEYIARHINRAWIHDSSFRVVSNGDR